MESWKSKIPTWVIYCATCRITGKSYVGQSKEYEERKYKHIYFSKTNKYKGKGHAFNNALKKHGAENFTWQILESNLTLDQANESEEFYVSYLLTLAPNGYNILPGGSNRKHSEATKKLISEKLKIVGSFVGKKGSAHPNFGRTLSDEHKKKVSDGNSGEKGGHSRLTTILVQELYNKALEGAAVKTLMADYKMGRVAVLNILNKKCWIEATAGYATIDMRARTVGEGLPNSKLTEKQVRSIISSEIVMTGSQFSKCQKLASQYSVSAHTIYQILAGIRWKHIPR